MFDRVRTRERIPLVENWLPIAVGAVVQLGATIAYFETTPEVGGGLLAFGLVGGIVAGTLIANPVASLVDGTVAGVVGAVLFAGYMLVVGFFESAGVGGVAGTNLFLMLYTNSAILLLVIAVPAHAVFGSIGGFLAGAASKRGGELIRARSEADHSR